MWSQFVSDHSIFVQRYYLDGDAQDDAVHKIYACAYMKVSNEVLL